MPWAAKQVPWYGGPAWRAPFPDSPEAFWQHWQTLPILTKPEVRAGSRQLAARNLPAVHQPVTMIRTSGSTGIPVEVGTTPVTRLVWNALTIREHRWWQRDFRKRLGVIRSRKPGKRNPRGEDKPSWGPPVALLTRTGPSSVIHIGFPLGTHVDWLRRSNPHYLLTYPSLMTALLDELGPAGKPPLLEQVRLISEPVDPALNERLRAEWGVAVADVYSANEVGNIAFRCPEEGRLHVQAESLLVEVLDEAGAPCAEGATGRVVVTSLHNLATPLIRYEIGDYATVGQACGCGRTLPVLARVDGRVRNMARRPDGTRYWPAALLGIRTVTPIRQFQYVQTALNAIELKVVVDRPLTVAEVEETARLVREVLRCDYRVQVTEVADIPRGPTGKFEEFLSLLPE